MTKKGGKIMTAMKKQYGEEKGKEVFYASKNAGKISGVEGKPKDKHMMPGKHPNMNKKAHEEMSEMMDKRMKKEMGKKSES